MDAEGESILEAANVQEDAPKMPGMPKDFKMPTQEELLKLISGFNNMPEEDKEDLKKNILSGQFLKKLGLDPKSQQDHIDSTRILIFVSCIAVMILIFETYMASINENADTADGVDVETLLKQANLGEKPDLTDPEQQEKIRQIVSQLLENEKIDTKPIRLEDMLFYLYFVFMLIILFFGYKLYRSQTEKERKREEKKKQKQQKKKHKQ